MAKRRRMTAKQRKYFGKRRTRKVYAAARVHKRRYVSMARYRKRGSRGGSRGGFGGMKSMIAPIVGGVADSYLDPMIPGFNGLGATGVGFVMHNNTLRDLGLYKLGFSIGNMIPLPGRTGTTSGGFT